jgi:hypothetical protein
MIEGGWEGFPLARSEDLLVEGVGAETVIYDGRSKEAHCLSPLAAVVFDRSDGRTSLADLAGIASSHIGEPVDLGGVEEALAELAERDLMIAPADGDGISRRELVRKTAVVTGTVWATPLILSSQAFGASFGACPNCPTGRLFALRVEDPGCVCSDTNDNNDCLSASPAGIAQGCPCLIPSHVTFTCNRTNGQLTEVVFTLAQGVQFCDGGGSGANNCEGDVVTVTPNPDGTTTVTVFKSNLSHADIVVCVAGSPPPPCAGT